MANIIIVKDMSTALSEYDPFLWKCDRCGKEKQYTQEEIDHKKKPWLDPEQHERNFSVSCPFCHTGEMEPPTFVSFGGFFADLTNE